MLHLGEWKGKGSEGNKVYEFIAFFRRFKQLEHRGGQHGRSYNGKVGYKDIFVFTAATSLARKMQS